LSVQANVFLNDIDYGSDFAGAIANARAGDVIEFSDSGTYTISGQQVLKNEGITVRSAEGYKATILLTDGGTNSTFMLEAPNITFENLIFEGSVYKPKSGTYVFGFFGVKDKEYNYPTYGLTVSGVDFLNVRAVIDAGSGWVRNLIFTNNTITNTNYGLGKSGLNYGGDCVITGNVFDNNGVGTDKNPAEPAIWIENNRGSLLIEGNTFINYDGRYAIYSNTDLSANPITLGANDYGSGIGGTGADYNLFPLDGGGYAVGFKNPESVVPEPTSIVVLGMGLCSIVGFRKLRK